jgi:hypothetical protein
VITVDGANYGVSGLSVSFWFDSVSSHSFSFASPLVVGSKQYAWNSTSGLSTLQGGALTMTAPGSIVGNYIIPNQITFDQVGVSSDFTGTVMIIDALSYSKEQLPISFSWSSGSTHSFAFQSPLIVEASNKQYVWTSTTGLSSSQNGSITVTTYGSIIGNYKTQYYLIVTSPYDSPIPLGGWFDFGASITDSVTSPVFGGSGTQYMCTGWSGTGSVPASGSTSSVTFMISAPSTITWIWKTQHQVTFDQTGVGTDFAGTVVTLDGLNYGVSGLPISFWLDNGSNHSFSFAWPLVVGSKQYAWNSTSGLSTFQSGTLTITASGNVIGNYFQQNGTNAHDFAVTNIASSKTVIGQGYCGNLILTLQNLGSFNEYFNVTIYANSTIINTLNFNLTSGKATTQDLLWNTTGFTYGNFTISAYTWPVPGETNTANNNFTGNVVTVTIPGDINGDFKVGLTDLVLLAQAYGSKLSDPNWNPTADIDGNGVVGLSDLVILAQQYGQNYP